MVLGKQECEVRSINVPLFQKNNIFWFILIKLHEQDTLISVIPLLSGKISIYGVFEIGNFDPNVDQLNYLHPIFLETVICPSLHINETLDNGFVYW